MYYLKFEGKKLFYCDSKANRGLTNSGAFTNSHSVSGTPGSSGPSSINSTASASSSSKQAIGPSSSAPPSAADVAPLECRFSTQLLTAMRSLARVAALAPQVDFNEDVRKQCLILLAGAFCCIFINYLDFRNLTDLGNQLLCC